MEWTTILASTGAILSIISNFPQLYRVLQPQTTKNIDPLSVIIHIIGAFTWALYGTILNLYILAVESGIVMLLWSLILLAVIRDGCLMKQDG